MSVDLFFAVPLVVNDVEPALHDAIRTKVSAYLASDAANQTITPSPEESVSTSYYKPEASILVDAELPELEAIVLAAASNYLERSLKLPPRHLEVERAWINIFEPGAQEVQHSHDGSLLSCSYYVEAPEDCGCIVFPDPIGARRSYREFTKTAGSDLLTRRDIAVEPKAGRLVMFESWMPHYVQCNKSEAVRISIAINLREAAADPVASPAGGSEGPAAAAAAAADGARRHATASTATPGATGSDGKPFLFNELFEVSANLGVDLEPVQDSVPTIIVDNFLTDPERVREIVGSSPATNWKHEPGGRNFVDYYDCRLRFPIRYPNNMITSAHQVILKVFGLNTRPADASVDVNWFMQINEKRGDFAVPHNDITEKVQRSFTCVLYLNRPQECSGGTAFFRFKKSGSLLLDEAYVQAVKKDSRISETGRDYWPEGQEDLWEYVGAVEMVPGRLLIFPSEYFHAAYHPQNSFVEFPRLTAAFWMIC